MNSTKTVIGRRWEASLSWSGRLKAGLPTLGGVSGDLENLAALQDGGI